MSGKTLSGIEADALTVTGVNPIISTSVSPGNTAVSLNYDGTTLTLDGMGRLHATGLTAGGVMATLPLLATAGSGNVTVSLNEGASVQTISNNLEVKTSAIVASGDAHLSVVGNQIESVDVASASALSSFESTTEAFITATDAAIAAIEAIQSTHTSQIAADEANITTLQGNVTTINSEITTVNGEITSINTSITSIDASIVTIDASLAADAAELATHSTEIAANTAGIAANGAAIATIEAELPGFQPLNQNLTNLSQSPPFLDVTTAGIPFTVESTTATASQNLMNLKETALATGNTTSMTIGAANTTSNATEVAFVNTGGTGSTTNQASLGIVGAPALTVDGSGNVMSNNSLSVNGPAATSSPIFTLQLTCPEESYTINTPSAHSGFFQEGTVATIEPTGSVVTTGGTLIDIGAYGGGGTTNIFLGAVGGGTANAAANFVVGRRTGTSTWAESFRIDTSGNVTMSGNFSAGSVSGGGSPVQPANSQLSNLSASPPFIVLGGVAPFAVSDGVSTASESLMTLEQSGLATGATTAMDLGASTSSFNTAEWSFSNLGGTGSTSNITSLGIRGGLPMTVDGLGNVAIPRALSVASSASVGSLLAEDTVGTGSGILSSILRPLLGTGNTVSQIVGSTSTLFDAGEISFENVAGAGSTSNLMQMGVMGAPMMALDGLGRVTMPSSLSIGSTFSAADSVTTASETMGSLLQPSVSIGNATTLVVGAASTAFNAARMRFVNAGGSGSTSNTVQIGLVGGNTMGIDGNGNVSIPGTITGGAVSAPSFSTNATNGTVSAAELTLTGPSTLSTPSFMMNLSCVNESYVVNTPSSHVGFFQAGTVATIEPSGSVVTTGGTLIDIGAFGGGGSTNVFFGAVGGTVGNGPANFVIGRRTASTSWAESLRIDTNGNGIFAGTVLASAGLFTSSSALITQVQDTGTTTSRSPFFVQQTALSTGNTTSLLVGISSLTNNSTQLGFTNVGGSGSATNKATIGLLGSSPLSIDGTGAIAINDTVDTGNKVMISSTQPNLAMGDVTQLLMGASFSTNNGAFFDFQNIGGTGSNTNTARMSVVGSLLPLTIDGRGIVTYPGQLITTSGYSSQVLYPATANDSINGSSGFVSTDPSFTATAPAGNYIVTAHVYLVSTNPGVGTQPNGFSAQLRWGINNSTAVASLIGPADAGVTNVSVLYQFTFEATIAYAGGTNVIKFQQAGTVNNNVGSSSVAANHQITIRPAFV